jgi:hypothetical protein
MKIWQAPLFLVCVAFAPRLAFAQAPPSGYAPQPGYAQPQQGYAPQGQAQPGALPPQGYAPQQGGSPTPQGYGQPPYQQGAPGTGYPQPAQGTKARTYPGAYDPAQGAQPPPLEGLAVGATASGQQGPPEAGATPPQEDLGHHKQLNLRTEIHTGYRMLYRYDTSPRCAPYDANKSSKDQQKFCGYGAPPTVGLFGGFALVDHFEPFAFVRLGLADEAAETNQGKLLQMGIGARIYALPQDHLKVFFSPWIGVDATSGPYETIGSGSPGTPGYDDAAAGVKAGSYKTDVLAHFDLGPQYDFSRGFGMYVSGGLTLQFVRYFGMTADIGIGIQARAP